MLTSCPLRYVSRQIEHSDVDSVSDGDEDRHIVTDDEASAFGRLFGVAESGKVEGDLYSSLMEVLDVSDSLRIRWIAAA